MKVVLIGATGATGKALLPLLLADANFSRVDVFVRRAPDVQHEKLHVHVVDFADVAGWCDKLRGDVLFSCLGTTLKAAGSQEAQWQVDYQAQYDVAQAAQANGVGTLVLVSSAQADPKARWFYPRMKGQLEADVAALGFARLLIFRPPLLLRPNSRRTAEVWGGKILQGLNRVGLLQSQRPLPTPQLAQAMLQAFQTASSGMKVYEAQDIRALLAHVQAV
ncbi:NAD(P)H-binding protein [Uruburuella testudinis]|uniref:NAD(P)H-binding protein n=1 Tax=Uruburuella testudinis TaxID=1282863 RepID=A0ABY4DWK9_9NEIS|nr:NAD(P)H-binding protein [Uruburuella testudinis]UOO83017.1 NAD(P)H-binding protein [Uruburuella testudinis]